MEENVNFYYVNHYNDIPLDYTGAVYITQIDSKCWYENGLCHREDGPAQVCKDGTQIWWNHGKLNKKDGPSIIYGSGTKVWYLNSMMHREDGPAIERSDGTVSYYLNSKVIKCSSTEEFIKLIKLKAFW